MQNAKTPQNMQSKSPAKATTRKRRATPGTLDQLARELWHATRTIGAVLDDPNLTPADACRVANSLAALANAYRGVLPGAKHEAAQAEHEKIFGRFL